MKERGKEPMKMLQAHRAVRPTGLVLAAALAATALPAGAQTSIGVSYQPALYWSAPYFIATEKGWWKGWISPLATLTLARM